MLKSIEIENLRGIAKGSLTDLTEMNVIVGPNNAGKSTILDAFLLGASPGEQPALNDTLARRPVAEPVRWLIRKEGRNSPNGASITVNTDRGERRQVLLVAHPTGNLVIGQANHTASDRNVQPITAIGGKHLFRYEALRGLPEVRLIDSLTSARAPDLSRLYTSAAETGLRRQAKELVKAVIPGLEDIEILTHENTPILYLDFPTYAHPVALAGDGIVLLLKMALELAACSGGVALLEEPETHLHPAAMKQCVAALWAAVKRGIQIVLTTHSLDLIDFLLAVDDEQDLAKVSVYRVQLENGILKSHRFGGTDALLARMQIEEDLR